MGSITRPDKWVLLKIDRDNQGPLFKVFGMWSGSYLYGDSWKMNSGISKIEKREDGIHFHGYSGSVYLCNPEMEGVTAYGGSIISGMISDAESNLGVNAELVSLEDCIKEVPYEVFE